MKSLRKKDLRGKPDRPLPGRGTSAGFRSRGIAIGLLIACVSVTTFFWNHSTRVAKELNNDHIVEVGEQAKQAIANRLRANDDFTKSGTSVLEAAADEGDRAFRVGTVTSAIPGLLRLYPGLEVVWVVGHEPGGTPSIKGFAPPIDGWKQFDLASFSAPGGVFDVTRDTGKSALSDTFDFRPPLPAGAVATEANTKSIRGIAMFWPVYSGPSSTVDERRANLFGWLGGILSADAWLEGAFANATSVGTAQVYLGTGADKQLYGSYRAKNLDIAQRDATVHAATVELLGKTWTIHYTPATTSESGQLANARTALLIMGLGVSVLVFLLAWWLQRSAVRAQAHLDDATRSLLENEERHRALLQASTDMIVVLDSNGIVTYASAASITILGIDAADAIGLNAFDFIAPENQEEALGRLDFLSQPNAFTAPLQWQLQRADGTWVWVEIVATSHLHNSAINGIIVNIRDIDERRRTEADLQEAEERFRSAFDEAPIGIILTDPDGRTMRVNKAYCDIFGRTQAELVGKPMGLIFHPEFLQDHSPDLRRLLNGTISNYRIERQCIHAEGYTVWVSISTSVVRGADGKPLYFVGQMEDITERKAIAERLAHQAIHDPLTGLPNRVLFMDRVSQALIHCQTSGLRCVVLFLDLDRFKFVNDSLGHAAGDRLLSTIGDRLRNALRPNDTVARFGGDEFTVLCEDIEDEHGAIDVAQRIEAVFEDIVSLPDGLETFVTVSIGVALSGDSDEPDTPESLVRNADAAMYRAKEQGRNRWALFDEGTRHAAVNVLQTGNDLHRALERDEFRVYYQPIIDLETGQISGFEALVRWLHPERGLIPPDQFIGLSEDTGLIVPLGRWVLTAACQQLATWQAKTTDRPPLTMSVNLSPRQLAEPKFPEQVARILENSGVRPGTVWLEITEGTLARDAKSAVSALRALRAQGVHLSVDDFGTGYSSMSYLKRYPVEALKVDRSFVDGLGTETDDTALVTATVSLAHALGLRAIAEGVETPTQLAELRTLGCEYGQGYLFGRPQPAQAFGDSPSLEDIAWESMRSNH